MPRRAKRFCLGHCGRIVDGGYCSACLERKKSSKKQCGYDRDSACKRGYDRHWREFRDIYLRKHPLCVDCLKEDRRAVSATDVHHIIKLRERPDLRFDEANLMSLCGAHHDARTARGQ